MTREEAKDYIREWCPYGKQDEIINALEQQPCEDCVSREQAIKQCGFGMTNLLIADCLRRLPSVTPKYTDEEIDRAQAVEQAYIDKMVELTVEERCNNRQKVRNEYE
jgi:hypothetical protein